MHRPNIIYSALFIALLCFADARAADLTAEDILPDSTLAALVVPDLAAARAQIGQTTLAEMFSQPEMQEFLKPIVSELRLQYENLRKNNPLLPAVGDLDAGLLSGEFSIGICPPAANNVEPSVFATLKPKDMAAFLRVVPEPFVQALQVGEPIPLGPPNGPRIVLTKERLLFCSSDAVVLPMLQRAKAATADALSKVPEYAAVKAKSPNAAGWIYLAPARVGQLIGVIAGQQRPAEAQQAKAVIQAFGVEGCSAFTLALSFRNGLPVLESAMRFTKDAPEGIPAMFTPPADFALKPETLAIAAPNCPFVSAGYVDLSQSLALVRRVVEAINPVETVIFEQNLKRFTQAMQFDLEKDVLKNIGPDVIAVQTPTDTAIPMSYFPGMVFSVGLKNPAVMEEVLLRVGEGLARIPEFASNPVYSFKKITIEGRSACYVSGILGPASPIFCVTKGRLLIGTSINALRRVFEQTAAGTNILSDKSFQDVIARVSGKPFDPAHLPAGFSYGLDDASASGSLLLAGGYVTGLSAMVAGAAEIPAPGKLAQPAMPMPNPALQFLMRPAGRALLPILSTVDMALWPDETFFRRYAKPTGSFMASEPGGAFSRAELPVPGPGGSGPSVLSVTAVTAVVAAIAIPSLLRSRMAANETAAAANCKAFAEAEEIYHRTDYNNDGVLEYAQSLQELHTGPNKEELAIVARSFAAAEAGPGRQPVPKAGYFFKVLKAQGANAPGGKKSFLADGKHMTLGYALLAYPSAYDGTGRNCFIISNNGTIFQADLGAQTPAIAEQMTEFDPKPNEWIPTE
ncbi:MAG TPA: DUF2950 family protein [Planctomycetota bacterium]|jgi:hypothetical protein